MISVEVLAIPEPGRCGWQLLPAQTAVPRWLAARIDWYVRPSAARTAAASIGRVLCEHVDWESVWARDRGLFLRREHLGAPPPPVFFHAAATLAALGSTLLLEVELEMVADKLALAVYGTGVRGAMTSEAWRSVAGLLTTCASTVREPWPRQLPVRPHVSPAAWVHDDHYTWWSYPFAGPVRESCGCAAEHGQPGAGFGPKPGGHRRG
ncbi:hypothetical protein [Alloactinosynnema sp. L-07]|uniref:hypothetical protein n=1 Tax=Alloactinosynnema sp. L-07 TaxID=1653480 RepID=UPI00065F0839|nr:hypothetical protein [Alloactinosynnema sp. L-07]CRK59299.1 hypothetical protein [Alloactinosynnema sp. L-07]